MAKLQAINIVLLLLILMCAPLILSASSDELNDTEHFSETESNAEIENIDTSLLTTNQVSNATDDGNDIGDYDATIIEITDTSESATDSASSEQSIYWENTTLIEESVSEVMSEPVRESTQAEKPPVKCKDGLILRAWPIENITYGDRFARGLVYFLAMCYLFLGVSIVSDRFMAAIEKITAIEKEIIVSRPDGTKQIVIVRKWNETVANLTLMALGTSAPEILLSIIEIFTLNFQAGDLGPSTIVGSAAFNLFCIIAICVVAIPTNQIRRIKHLRVFFVTAAFSIFAYGAYDYRCAPIKDPINH